MTDRSENNTTQSVESKAPSFEKPGLIRRVIRAVYYRLLMKFTKHKKDIPELKEGMKIAFVCYGNICRSPFAEFYARKHYKGYEFYSYGFIEEDNRPTPENGIKAAEKWEIDLSVHASKHLTEDIVEEMDVIFVMDKMNYLMFKDSFKSYLSKVYYLDNENDIMDPFRQEVDYFEYIYDIISGNIDRLFIKKQFDNLEIR